MSVHRGHCRCGGVEMHASQAPNFLVYCHCDDCRRSTGAPLLASVAFPKESVVWDNLESLAEYGNQESSRLFCNNCGSPVAQKHAEISDRIVFNTGFMDNPDAYPPTAHTFASKQISWLAMDDKLPLHDKTILIKRG
ncbi:MAG: GFA family protein [Pseudomonadota bacterium]